MYICVYIHYIFIVREEIEGTERERRLLIRSTDLEIAVGIHWLELWGGLAALWATIGSLGMFPPLFLPTTPLRYTPNTLV